MIKNHIVFNDISDWRFRLTKAQGSYIWDEKGRKYIDFTSGWNVTNLGWNHPEVNEAVAKQARKNTYSLLWSTDETREELASTLVASLPKSLDSVCRATGGTEANEEAMKIARAITGRKKIIGFRDSYHGQSFGVMALGYRPEYVTAIAPLVPNILQINFPSTFTSGKNEIETLAIFLEQLEKILKKKDIAAIVTEAGIITGWGSTLVAPRGFLAEVRRLTKRYGTLLILDEVGTGFSRCGKLFGMELEGVIPDIATFAKGMSNGAAAIGALAVNSNLVEPTLDKTNLTSTFGWTPVACAAAKKALEIHLRDKVWEQAAEKGKFLMKLLKEQLGDHPKVGNIRGIGMEIGVTFLKGKNPKTPDEDFAKLLVNKAFKKGLHIIHGGDGNIQIMPPLTTSQGVLKQGVDIFIHSMNEVLP